MNNGGNQQGTGGNTQQGKQKKQHNDIEIIKQLEFTIQIFLRRSTINLRTKREFMNNY